MILEGGPGVAAAVIIIVAAAAAAAAPLFQGTVLSVAVAD